MLWSVLRFVLCSEYSAYSRRAFRHLRAPFDASRRSAMDEKDGGDGLAHWKKANAELRCEEEVNLRLKVQHRKLQEIVDELEIRLDQAKDQTKQAHIQQYDTCAAINSMHAQIRETNARLKGLGKRIDLQRAKNKADQAEVAHRKDTLDKLLRTLHNNIDALESIVGEWKSMRSKEDRNTCIVTYSAHTQPNS